jgi:hypothetical protein
MRAGYVAISVLFAALLCAAFAHSTFECAEPIVLGSFTTTYRQQVIDSLFNVTLNSSSPYTNECIDLATVNTILDYDQDDVCVLRWTNTSSLVAGCNFNATNNICYDQIPAPSCTCFGLKSQIECVMLSISNWRRRSVR